MALAARFSLLNANFDRFLFASIGEEENGMPLSVASALARLGADPWAEARRLAELPREAATEALAAMIARTASARLTPSDAPGIAAQLVLLLPSKAASSPAPQTGSIDLRQGWANRLVVLLCLALLALALFNLIAG